MKLKPGMILKIKNETVFLYGKRPREVRIATHVTYILGRTLIFIDEKVDETYKSKNACQVYCAENASIVSVDKVALLSHYVRMPKNKEEREEKETWILKM